MRINLDFVNLIDMGHYFGIDEFLDDALAKLADVTMSAHIMDSYCDK